MPNITLEVRGKHVTGPRESEVPIVCMNNDYRVHLTIDAGSMNSELRNKPYKYVVVKYGREYREAEIRLEDATYVANLPKIVGQPYIELGVCGKSSKDGDPEITTNSVRVQCEKSVLCGTVIKHRDPVLIALDTMASGTHRADEYGADGFYEVNVNVVREHKTEELSMVSGAHVITPSYHNYLMSKVTIVKPPDLIPENIRKGKCIGGVVGTYEYEPTHKYTGECTIYTIVEET